MQSVFTLTNSLNLTIINIDGYVYKSPFTKDSIASLTTYLNTKKYIDTFQFKAGVVFTVYGYTAIECRYQYMDITAQNDWINTMQELNLTEVIPTSDTMKDAFVNVPIGQEQALMDILRKDPIVSWVDLNYIDRFQLY